MTETEWLACTDPQKMLEFMRGKVSDRKLRLFGVACCRRILHLMPDQRSRCAVQVAEMLADKLLPDVDAEAAGYAAAEVSEEDFRGVSETLGWRAARAADHLLPLPEEAWQLEIVWEYVATALEGEQFIREGANPAMLDAWSDQSVESGRPMGWTNLDPEKIIAEILREIIGLIPLHPDSLNHTWLAWNDGIIPKLAQAIYDEPAFDRMPILADALEEAGCTDTDILNHCRQPGEHVRGCWVVDLLLGKS